MRQARRRGPPRAVGVGRAAARPARRSFRNGGLGCAWRRTLGRPWSARPDAMLGTDRTRGAHRAPPTGLTLTHCIKAATAKAASASNPPAAPAVRAPPAQAPPWAESIGTAASVTATTSKYDPTASASDRAGRVRQAPSPARRKVTTPHPNNTPVLARSAGPCGSQWNPKGAIRSSASPCSSRKRAPSRGRKNPCATAAASAPR
jgi:hypothetical protein